MTTNDLGQGMLENTIPLLFGHPDPATLLPPELRQAMQQVISSPRAYAALQYGPEQGTPGLIDFLVAKINREQGLSLQPGNLMVVAGSTHAVDMLARLYARPGEVLLVEAPTYVDAIRIFRDQQIELCSIPTDESGLIPSELEKRVAGLNSSGKVPSMLYTIPNFHNPTGTTLPEERRLEIIRLAHRYGFLIVEDDVYRDLSFEGPVPASFYALSHGERAVSIGSFSKTLAPGLRLGWLVGSEEVIQRCINCGTMQMGGGANPFVANIVAEYCRSGHWEKHIVQLQSLYKGRRDVALSALSQYMPADVKWTHPLGGFFIWLTLPEQVFVQDVKRLALQEGVTLAAGEGFFVHPAEGEHHLRLAYSCASPSDIDAGIRILAQVISKIMNKREIHFPNGNMAQLILPPAGTGASDLLRILDIQQPDAVIIIAGGASEMDEEVHPDLIRLFTRGIAQVAASTRALIIDGGTQAGVMAIMGQEVAGQERRSILLGVAPAGSVTYPGQSTGIKGNEAVPLDPNHSYFVLVETDEWGGETDTMYELAKTLSAGHPSIAILINGGSIAKSEVLHNVRQRRPIIVMEGSGRLADEIARLWKEKPLSIRDPELAEVILHGDIHVFPLTGSTMELVQLTKRLLQR